MTELVFLELMRETIFLTFMISLPLLLIGTVVGVIVSIFQTATSIQDQSLSFIPKLLATALGIQVFGPWMFAQLMNFANRLFTTLHQYAR